MWYNNVMEVVDRPLAELVQALPPNAQATVRDFVEYLLAKHEQSVESDVVSGEDKDGASPGDPRRQAMLREIEAYHRLHPELSKKYKGQHVAIFHGQLVDHDLDAEALLERTMTRFPDQVVLQRKVENTPEIVLRFRSPRLISAL